MSRASILTVQVSHLDSHWLCIADLEAAPAIPVLWLGTTRFKQVRQIPLNHPDRIHTDAHSAVDPDELLPDVGLGGLSGLCE